MELTAGRWRVRLLPFGEAGPALDLRARMFRDGRSDVDAFDPGARHLAIDDGARTLACARLVRQSRARIGQGYTAQRYDLAAFAARFPRALEIGRVCVAPGVDGAEAARLLLAALARVAARESVAVVYGCASFPASGAGMARLAGHVAPGLWAPRPRVGAVPLSRAPGRVPPLLRAYLALGAAVSDHAVPDAELGTQHVFAALPLRDVPPRRARRLVELLDAA